MIGETALLPSNANYSIDKDLDCSMISDFTPIGTLEKPFTGTFDGNTASTRWGPVQVRIVVKDGKIVSASALKSPNGDSRSRSIAAQAIPYLIQETLAAQSDQISGVGGASYTSNGWYQSLQSALKKAGL